MAEKTPIGTAIISVAIVIRNVFIIAGSIDTLSVLYVHSKRLKFMLGIPFTNMYPIISRNTDTVISAARLTRPRSRSENGLFLYPLILSLRVSLFIATMFSAIFLFSGILSKASTIFYPSFFITEKSMFIISMNTNSTTPVPIRACL